MSLKFEAVVLMIVFPLLLGLVQGQCSQPKKNSTCASACEPTCGTQPEVCILSCVEDCICPRELVRHNDGCVLPSNCPGADCPLGVARHACLVAPCRDATCPHHPDAVCVDDYCGGCNARFFKDAKEVTDDCDSNCTYPKVFRSCGTACPTTCENRDDELTVCTLDCVPRCACPEPLVEAHSLNSTCVSRCPGDPCEAPKSFTRCGSACPSNCDNLNPICIERCEERCACPDGMVETSATDSTCIPATECPNRCEAPKVFTRCGSACPSRCDNFVPICITVCVERCACPDGMVEAGPTNSTCVPVAKCPIGASCEAPKTFSTCASECPPNCDDLVPRCNKRCVQNCRCPDGMVEVSATNSTCIAKDNCPGTNPVPVIIGGGVAAVAAVSVLVAICLKMRN